MASRLQEQYKQEIIPTLKQEFGYQNVMAVPKLDKVSVNVGLNARSADTTMLELVEKSLTRITGQKPVKTKAKKAISAFKVREGMVVGMKVTLRGSKMYDFVDKLINITIPRIRDFRGLDKKMVDKQGNLTIGFKEHNVFPEIRSDEIERLHGLEVTIATTAKDREAGLRLFELLGVPFKK